MMVNIPETFYWSTYHVHHNNEQTLGEFLYTILPEEYTITFVDGTHAEITKEGTTETYGVQMTPANKEYLKGLIAKYVEDLYEFIPSYELLDEFLYFGARNTDRAMAFGITLMLLEDYSYPIQTTAQAISKTPHFGYRRTSDGKINRVIYSIKQA